MDLKVPISVCLPNLKQMCLIGPTLGDDDSPQRLIQCCPLLQELDLCCILGRLGNFYAEDARIQIEILDVSSPFLRN